MYAQYMGAAMLRHLVQSNLEAQGFDLSGWPTCSLFDPAPAMQWWKDQTQLKEKYGMSAGELNELDLHELFQSEAGPVDEVISVREADISRYPPPAPGDMQKGLWSTLWCAWSVAEAQDAAVEMARRREVCPHAKLALWCSQEVQLPRLEGYKTVRLRSGQGQLLVSRQQTALPALTNGVWPEPPSKEVVSTEEEERRKQAKYVPVNLHTDRFVEFGFDREVVDIVHSVPINYLGDRGKRERVEQYPLDGTPDAHELTVKEVNRAIACEAIAVPPPGIVVTKVHSFVAVFKGGKTRVCLDLSVNLNDWIPSIPFNLPQFDSIGEFVSCKGNTWMAKYDLRDFFWNLKVAPCDQGLFGLIHPGTKELMVHSRLPFGYKDSPRIACKVSEAVAEYLRTLGVNCKVFVDDFAIAADSYEECLCSCSFVKRYSMI
jgi:hypothetical protein